MHIAATTSDVVEGETLGPGERSPRHTVSALPCCAVVLAIALSRYPRTQAGASTCAAIGADTSCYRGQWHLWRRSAALASVANLVSHGAGDTGQCQRWQ